MGIKSLYTTNKVLEKLSLVHFCTVLNETARKETNFWCNYPN